MNEKNWMTQLSFYFENCRRHHPEEKLMIVFDIDGTILDMRYMILNVLTAYDRKHQCAYFRDLDISKIKIHENQLEELLSQMDIPSEQHPPILNWYHQQCWAEAYLLSAHQPFNGVLEVIRWFQLQENTVVGLNTGRPESIRKETLASLNQIGKTYKVQFEDTLLHMSPYPWGEQIPKAKVEGIRKFQAAGFRVFAFIDNEPENLKAIEKIDRKREIFLLHANTLFDSKRVTLPFYAVKGSTYDLTALIPKKSLPKHVQFVWQGVNDETNIRQFLASDIQWGECDLRMTPTGNRLALRHDPFWKTPFESEDHWLSLDTLLNRISRTGKSLKFDLKEGGILIDHLIEIIDSHKIDPSRLWFHGDADIVQETGFKTLSMTYPKATLQTSVDFLAPLILSNPKEAKATLNAYASWGVRRFLLDWRIKYMRPLFEKMEEWDFQTDICNVHNLEEFLEAVLLTPTSITADFNFPKWSYFGRGSGENGQHHEYTEMSI